MPIEKIVYQLSDTEKWFPDPLSIPDSQRDEEGLFAVGGDLSTERLIEAYSQGIFPWSDFRSEELLWWCPTERFVIFPDKIHISHSMRTLLNSGRYHVTFDKAFERVIGRCSEQRIHETGAWLGTEMVEAYTRLHHQGFAHSAETWNEKDELIGGLYGVEFNHCFMGESMFSDAPNGSKIALIGLAKLFVEIGIKMIDCQFETPHLKTMGGCHISYKEYMDIMWANQFDTDK